MMSTDSLSYFWSLASRSCPNWKQPASTPPPSLVLLSGAVPNLTVLLRGYTTWILPFPSLQPCCLCSHPALPLSHRDFRPFSCSAIHLPRSSSKLPLENSGLMAVPPQPKLTDNYSTFFKPPGRRKENAKNTAMGQTQRDLRPKTKRTKQNNKTYSEIPITFPLLWWMSKKEEIWRK